MNTKSDVCRILSGLLLMAMSIVQLAYPTVTAAQSVPGFTVVPFATGITGAREVSTDPTGNVYSMNPMSGDVYKISPAGVASTFASLGPGSYVGPYFEPVSGNLFVSTCQAGTNSIFKINGSGVSSNFGPAFLTCLSGFTSDASGNLYVSEYTSPGRVLKITPLGIVSTYATGLNFPDGLDFDPIGMLYVGDRATGQVMKVPVGGGAATGFVSGFNFAIDVASDDAGNIYVTDYFPGTILKISPTGVVSTFGTGFVNPDGLAFDLNGNNLFIAAYGDGVIYKVKIREDQVISFNALANKTYGGPAFAVSATATSGLPVTFSSAGSCTVSGNTVTIIQAGSCTITANQSGNSFWNAALPVSQSFTIFKATPTVFWSNPLDIIYGASLGAMQLNATASVAGSFTYTPAAGTVLNSGNGQTLSVLFTPSDSNNYNSITKSVVINVLKVTPVINWSNPTTIVYGTPLSGTQLNATANVPGNFVYTPAAGTMLNAGNGQTLHVDFTPTDTLNYSGASKDVTINVFFAKPIIEWNNPEDIEYGTPLSAVQLNATADVPGSFTYTPPAGTVLNAGLNQSLQAMFQPDNPNYTGKSLSVSINVYKGFAKLLITSPSSGKFGVHANVGDPPITAAASSNSDAPITFTAGPPEVCTSSGPYGSTIMIVGFGSCTVSATQEESANYSGGSASVSFYVNGRPVANAGTDQTVNENALVVLNGLASNDPENDDLTYTWTQVAGTAVTLDNTAPAQPTFTVPSLTYLQDGCVLTFQLVVNDGQIDSLSSIVNVTAKNVNRTPVAYALAAAAVNEGSAGVSLNGSTSYDEDGEALTYAWLQTAGPSVMLSNVSAAAPTFDAPLVGASGALLTFQLTVTDPVGANAMASVNIQVTNVNQAPTANAGINQTVNESSLVTLNGSTSSDPDNDTLSFSWSQVSGTPVTLSVNSVNKPTFTAPAVGPGGDTLTFKLTVNDGLVSSGDSVVNVLVQNVNDPPACNAARPNLAVLWPPDHRLVPVSILGVTDPNNDQVVISITGVTQDERVNGLGDGDSTPDAVLSNGQLLLRAERAGNGNGRVYRVSFTAGDGNGGSCSGFVNIGVPRDMKPGNAAVDSGQNYNSMLP